MPRQILGECDVEVAIGKSHPKRTKAANDDLANGIILTPVEAGSTSAENLQGAEAALFENTT
jgi:hypothetical protein